jgi:hypothetical protein
MPKNNLPIRIFVIASILILVFGVVTGVAIYKNNQSSGTSTQTSSETTSTSSTASTNTTVSTASKADTKSTTITSTATTITNIWSGAKVDSTKLPIGDSNVTTSGASIGKLFACSAGNKNAPGASADGPWINTTTKTWDSTTKLAVNGKISWPTAKYSESVSGGYRTLVSNDLPVDYVSGTFPIASDDPSYQYDKNPGKITSTDTTVKLPENGTVASSPTCLPEGPVGMLKNGVLTYSSLDGKGQDAVAHESQDVCDGHPAMTEYHYHQIPSCIRNATSGTSTVVGWIADGFPIVIERDASGALPTNADLDECHGRTSDILIDGKTVNTYHYSATLEFPYFIGCYKGTATRITN